MKITLINPPISTQERYGSIVKEGGGKQPPLGICYLAAVLRDNNYVVSLIDGEAENLAYEEILKRIEDSDIVGITSTSVAFHRALELAQKIKERYTNKFIVIGGPHVSCFKGEVLEHKEFDYGVYGEGEYTLLELVECLLSNYRFLHPKKYSDVKGLIYRDNNKIIVNPPRENIKNLDNIPMPAVDLLKDLPNTYRPPLMNFKAAPVFSIITSRSCPNLCAFCDKSVFGGGYRAHSPERVIAEAERGVKLYGMKELSVVDDTFTIQKNRVYKFCKLKMNNSLLKDIPFNARISANSVDKDLLLEMRKSGCYFLEIGVESGSERVLKDIKKGTTHKQLTEIINYAYDIGYQIKIFVMIGYATDDKQSIEETIKYVKSVKATSMVCTIFTPFKGTLSYWQAKEHGTILVENDFTKYNNWSITFLPRGITEDEIMNYWRRINKEFYLRPVMIWRNLKYIRSFRDIKRYAGGVWILFKMVFKK